MQSTRQQSTRPFLRLRAEMCWQTPFMEMQLINWQKNVEYKDFPKWNTLSVRAVTRTAWQRGVSKHVHIYGRA